MEMREYIEAIAESCRKLIISKPATKQEEYRKIIVQKKEAFFQMEKYTDKQVFHENLSVEELETALEELMQNHFRQLNGFDIEAEHILLVSKKGVPSYKKKKLQNAVNETATHNRKKNYLLEEGKVIPPLVDMGIFTAEGKIVRTMYDKFKQINRFVEIIDDYVKDCKKEKLHIIDFGCGTATDFALYNAISWDAEMIFSVPCCQHELNEQMESEKLHLMTRYGIIKERFAALTTDAIRANLLECCGYKSQVLEFVDLSHTPKNLLIRARKAKISKEHKQKLLKEVDAMCEEFQLKPLLYGLLQVDEGRNTDAFRTGK